MLEGTGLCRIIQDFFLGSNELTQEQLSILQFPPIIGSVYDEMEPDYTQPNLDRSKYNN